MRTTIAVLAIITLMAVGGIAIPLKLDRDLSLSKSTNYAEQNTTNEPNTDIESMPSKNLESLFGIEPVIVKPNDDLELIANFELHKPGTVEAMVDLIRIDHRHGFFVLSQIENFFFFQRNGDNSWRPQEFHVEVGKTIPIFNKNDPSGSCSVLVCPRIGDNGKTIELTIESPAGSTFTLNDKVEVILAPTSFVWLTSQTLLDNNKRQQYLLLSVRPKALESQ